MLGNKGLAVSVTPPSSTLEPWGRLVLRVSAFNDMCGDYFDTLHLKVEGTEGSVGQSAQSGGQARPGQATETILARSTSGAEGVTGAGGAGGAEAGLREG